MGSQPCWGVSMPTRDRCRMANLKRSRPSAGSRARNSSTHSCSMPFLKNRSRESPSIRRERSSPGRVGTRQDVFDGIEKEYREFLGQFKAVPQQIIPVSAKLGDNIANRSERMPWYSGTTVLDGLSAFRKEPGRYEQPLRLPVQDVYKF